MGKKKRARHCAAFLANVHDDELWNARGEEHRKEEDVKDHEFLCIDVGWGIHNRDPKPLDAFVHESSGNGHERVDEAP